MTAVVENGIIVGYTPSNPYANILTIPDILDGQQIIGIGQSVFYEMGLIGINLPSSLQVIQYSAFAHAITADDSGPAPGKMYGQIMDQGVSCLVICKRYILKHDRQTGHQHSSNKKSHGCPQPLVVWKL